MVLEHLAAVLVFSGPVLWIVLWMAFDPEGSRLAARTRADGSTQPERILEITDHAVPRSFSPHGKWLAYASNESGTLKVYVRPYPGGAAAGKWQVSTAGGRYPIWSRNGKELFFDSLDGHIMVTGYTAKGETFSPGRQRRRSETAIYQTAGYPTLDLAPDGKRFVFDEMRRRSPNK